MSDKAREFWLRNETFYWEKSENGSQTFLCAHNKKLNNKEAIHVIEYSAYEAAIKQVALLEKERDEIYKKYDWEARQTGGLCKQIDALAKERDEARECLVREREATNRIITNLKFTLNNVTQTEIGLIAQHKEERDQLLSSLKEAVEALKVISTNGENRGMGWTPAQHAVIEIAKLRERHGELK